MYHRYWYLQVWVCEFLLWTQQANYCHLHERAERRVVAYVTESTISRWSLMRRSSWVNLWWSVLCRHGSLQVLHYLTWWSSTFRLPHTAQRYRVENLYEGPLDDQYDTVITNCDRNYYFLLLTSPLTYSVTERSQSISILHLWRTLFFTWLQRRWDKKRGDRRVHYFLLFYSFLQACVCPVHHESHVEKKK